MSDPRKDKRVSHGLIPLMVMLRRKAMIEEARKSGKSGKKAAKRDLEDPDAS
ncbi:hypothetical protein [Brevundimonas sp.]|uniref:hypothetical protein n=1 Tax=Brevundimonas sp. TaxID=1871086 RepID=UPI003AF53668